MSDLEEKIREIDKELDQILGAKYGKDVRQSIHDSIAKCYDEATGKIQQELIDSITENANKATTAADKSESEAARASSQAAVAEGYAIGDTDSAKYYFNQVKDISQSLSGTLKPRGTVAYAQLPDLESADAGDMYNIEDEFVTTDLFKEGTGKTVPAGSNVYKTADSMWDILAGSPVTGVKGAKESTYKQGNVNITAEHIGALATDGDAGDTTVAYTSNDSTAAPDATPPALLTTGEKLSSLFGKISTLAKNIRWLLGKMGSTDISAIGDGTITGALFTLNSNYSKLGAITRTDLGGTVPVPSGVFTAICIAYGIQPGTYLLIGMMSDRKDIQYTRLSQGNNADDVIANQPYGSRTLVTVKTFTEVTTVTFWVYQNASASMNFEQNEASIIAIRIK